MGAALGLLAGIGLLLIWQSRRPRSIRISSRPSLRDRLSDLLGQAGVAAVSPTQVVLLCAVVWLVVLLVAVAVTRTVTLGCVFASFAAYAPVAWLKRRRRQRVSELRTLWPDVVDNLASAIRAGMSLPDAVASVGLRGPAPLRPAFRRFGEEFRATGRFGDCLDRLKATLADPVADRIVESLRVAREVGGTDLGRLLRTLSQFLRDDARTRAELETRQGWTVNAARLALAAPWVVVALIALRPEAVAAYDSPTGVLVLAVGGAVSLLAYRLMVRIGRLPEERRVLR